MERTLLFQQAIAAKVVDFHGVAHVAEGGGGGFPRFLAAGFQIDYQYVITGIIVLVAVYADIRSRKRRN